MSDQCYLAPGQTAFVGRREPLKWCEFPTNVTALPADRDLARSLAVLPFHAASVNRRGVTAPIGALLH